MDKLYSPLLIEIAWEACNKVGGIYTVLQSKVPFIKERWDRNYCLIGPKPNASLPIEFQERIGDSPFAAAVKTFNEETGFKAYFGDWLITGKPSVILLDIQDAMAQKESILAAYQEETTISAEGNELVEQVIIFGHLSTLLMEFLAKENKNIIGHYHEWMAASHLPQLKAKNISTVFTTHATSLGRYLAMNEENFYRKLPSFEWESAARHYGIFPQVSMERNAAHATKVMTTVSRVTDKECEFLLGRKSDLILPNGLNIQRFQALHEFQNLHLDYKEKIHEFVMGHFFNNYTFDLNDTLYFFTSGRFEYINKGYDITIDALAQLNEQMKRANIKKNIVMFFITKREFYSINPLVLQSRSMLDELKQTTDAIQQQIGKKLFYFAAKNEDHNMPDLGEFVDEYWQFRYKKTIQRWKSDQLPIIVTHNLKDDNNDEIIQHFRRKELFNQADNPVKVIYHPDFIDSTNPLFKLDYEQFVRGCHLGIFPSYYEPWGYTPVECIAKGVPTVTSDLAGFGDYAKSSIPQLQDKGVFTLSRRKYTYEESVQQLTDFLFDFVQQSRRERIAQRNKVESISESFSWKSLGRHYIEAYRMAMEG